jgi:hypothetical protein
MSDRLNRLSDISLYRWGGLGSPAVAARTRCRNIRYPNRASLLPSILLTLVIAIQALIGLKQCSDFLKHRIPFLLQIAAAKGESRISFDLDALLTDADARRWHHRQCPVAVMYPDANLLAIN